jgi:hypothetical protein
MLFADLGEHYDNVFIGTFQAVFEIALEYADEERL